MFSKLLTASHVTIAKTAAKTFVYLFSTLRFKSAVFSSPENDHLTHTHKNMAFIGVLEGNYDCRMAAQHQILSAGT